MPDEFVIPETRVRQGHGRCVTDVTSPPKNEKKKRPDGESARLSGRRSRSGLRYMSHMSNPPDPSRDVLHGRDVTGVTDRHPSRNLS